ncbi:MAG: M23 family metallopeptidase [Chitinophagaceae bacterium]|nr:MAG: M23 family metallopeptidase [Chitinophagaceae bacterium]
MKNRLPILFLPLFFGAACGPARNVFHKDSPREAYERRLDKADIDETPEGRAWKAAAAFALEHPHPVALPYRQSGFFGTEKPRALALRFSAREGQRLQLSLSGTSPESPLYAELFSESGGATELLLPADPATGQRSFDVPATGNYLLRLQPELGKGSRYALSIGTAPSLTFPVNGGKAGSFWGADRDGGARRHEGIDIFAAKRTPAIAAADGTVTSVAEGGLGGKYVFLRPNGKSYNLYYAHLDEQLVQAGQQVRAGETIGLVGNTGNARTTPPHLHFGVYGRGGAVDPLPFIDRGVKEAPALAKKDLPAALKLKKALREGLSLPANTVLAPLALTAKGYLAEAPDGSPLLLPFAAVTAVGSRG